ncbi:MAG TPA: oligopeptide ABC transporter permease [Roseiflexaceae bacterium]|nr:oligopeptide ABC transporter permease [Roseiflexaceae bacterium]
MAATRVEGAELIDAKIEKPWQIVLERFLRHRLAVLSVVVLVTIIAVSIAAPLLAPYDPNRIVLAEKDNPPSAAHLMGTDYNGRDMLSRILYAGRVSLGIAFSVVIFSGLLGSVVGVVSGFFGGWVDAALMRLVDFMLTLPLLPILLVLITIFSPSIPLLVIVLVLTGWTGTARLVRGQVLSLREQQFVEASRALGASRVRLMFAHLIPNSLAPIIVSLTLAVSDVVVAEAALSYLGFGVQPPDASWGNMIRGVTSTVLEKYPWQAFFPGLMIFLTSLSVNFLGDGLRDAFDPRQRL